MNMDGNFYAFPSKSTPFNSTNPRQLLTIRDPPPTLLLYPPILQPTNIKSNNDASGRISESNDYALSTHIIPAAYPRVAPFVPLPSDAALIHSQSSSLSKEERRERGKKLAEEIINLKRRQIQGEFPPDEREDRVLWNCVTRYYHKPVSPKGTGKRKSVTLLLLHANGFPKETWEPFLRYLISSIQHSDPSVSIDEIWSFEAVQHGDSALINQDKLGALYDWSDHSRDILNFLTRYLPSFEDASTKDLPLHLPRVSDETERRRLQRGFAGESPRTLVAIGHSLGGATVTLAALTSPRLFSSLILVDPVIIPPFIDRTTNILALALGAVQRRHIWSSRDEARRQFASSPFFAAWDPSVLDNYILFGLTPTQNGVQLKTLGVQEAVVFAESRVAREVFERLKDLDPQIPVHWIMAGKGSWITGSEAATRELVWRRPFNVTNRQIASSEHLIVQQAPKELAREVRVYLENMFVKNDMGKARL